ncbi:DNA polymerase III subunit [Aeoliella mucimassa]|uniref:DNA polymerase III subunit tau n=1 Tax=Aeoliella mucimassa TaxID=2527972 RepID=A0A518ASI9_9BACT|nr:DNA polymerase III subunit [Aeoliella mucimassa]QDU57678.1 DNA polymerase III subunit tau [Aeoliella mucimassa]
MWMNIEGHDQLAQRFAHVLGEGRLASTYLFVGPGGIGKRLFARRLAECLFCSQSIDSDLTACGQCESCRLMAAGNHPDFLEVGLLKDKRSLLLEQFIGDKAHRHQEGLCHDISLRPYLASRRVAVIDNADTFNTETANALLKTLEEPPPHSLLILIGTSESKQLPTIRSRSQIVRFAPLQPEVVARLLLETGEVDNPQVATTVSELAEGSLDQARAMADEQLWQLHTTAVELLDRRVLDSVRLAEVVHEYSNAAGKDAEPRRQAMLRVLGLVARHYRRQLRHDPNSPVAPYWIAKIDRCLDAEMHVVRNVHLQTVIQAWADDLARA